jgi:2-oxoglutarate ferredoxin oxidoreductase subunit alpha
MILGDGFMGQMMEAVEFKEPPSTQSSDAEEWAVGFMGKRGKRALVKSLYLDPEELEQHNQKLQRKYHAMTQNEVRYESYQMEGAEIVLAAYGTTARIARSAIMNLRKEGVPVGMIRPITLFPFPYAPFETLPKSTKNILVVEMSMGQMIDDVKIGVGKDIPISFYGRSGGIAPSVKEIEDQIRKIAG